MRVALLIVVTVLLVVTLAPAVRAALAWFVVRGYGFPPVIVAGPFSTWNECNDMARFLNRQYLTYDYHCTQLSYP